MPELMRAAGDVSYRRLIFFIAEAGFRNSLTPVEPRLYSHSLVNSKSHFLNALHRRDSLDGS